MLAARTNRQRPETTFSLPPASLALSGCLATSAHLVCRRYVRASWARLARQLGYRSGDLVDRFNLCFQGHCRHLCLAHARTCAQTSFSPCPARLSLTKKRAFGPPRPASLQYGTGPRHEMHFFDVELERGRPGASGLQRSVPSQPTHQYDNQPGKPSTQGAEP